MDWALPSPEKYLLLTVCRFNSTRNRQFDFLPAEQDIIWFLHCSHLHYHLVVDDYAFAKNEKAK